MGTWSTSLYGSDFAADMKADFASLARLPGSTDDIVARLMANHGPSVMPDEQTEFWLVLADCLHAYGLEHPATFEQARDVIGSGRDLAAMQEREMSPADLRKRSHVLQSLLSRWSQPAPRRKRRNVLTAPEPHAFPVGTILVYPTDHGDVRNPYFGKKYYDWSADGWGSAVVIGQGHAHGFFAWSAIARLSAHGARRPSLERCRAASIETQPWWMKPDGEGTLAVESGSLPGGHVRKMGLEAIGRVTIDAARLARLSVRPEAPQRIPAPTIVTVFRWWTRKVWTRFQFRMPEDGVPRPAIALSEILR